MGRGAEKHRIPEVVENEALDGFLDLLVELLFDDWRQEDAATAGPETSQPDRPAKAVAAIPNGDNELKHKKSA